MSSFQEIKTLFTTEITNSPQYVVATKIKDLLIQDIVAPNIDYTFIYQLQETDYIDLNNKPAEEIIITMALKLILGIDIEIINGQVIIIMNKFL